MIDTAALRWGGKSRSKLRSLSVVFVREGTFLSLSLSSGIEFIARLAVVKKREKNVGFSRMRVVNYVTCRHIAARGIYKKFNSHFQSNIHRARGDLSGFCHVSRDLIA